MVKKKSKHIRLKISTDGTNSYEYITNILVQTLGYEITQAANCANIIMERGEYIVKSFKPSEMETAVAILELLEKYDILAQLINSED